MDNKNSPAKIKANNKYDKKTYDKLSFRVKKGQKDVLTEFLIADFLGKLLAALFESLGLAELYVVVPDSPRLPAVLVFQRHKQRVILQPIRLIKVERGVADVVLKRRARFV